MTAPSEKSANEIEALILKAARGGGVPLGHAEDLAMAAAYLDLGKITQCPCAGDPSAVVAIPLALDRVAVGEGPQTVRADANVIAALVAVVEQQSGRTLIWDATEDGAILHRFEDGEAPAHVPLGRRNVPTDLLAHLDEMASKTLVPETDASRLAGAGAGLTDND